MTVGDRLQLIIDEMNITQVQLAKELGITSNYVNQLVKNKKTNISEPIARLIEQYYRISYIWLTLGIGDMRISQDSPAKIEIINAINKMSDSEVKATLAFAKTLKDIDEQFSKKTNNKTPVL